ncbi:MAG: alpha/beta fold hydrolase [Hydrogenophaga sp.]|uniref:alpha/beta fold hydrolase n=1 Tax=Hydrogenophaga sp. TaxID=1904254 RepID=UPI001DDDD85E|nr:alpha/beta hydrolase [Hydrogenophaga sp.]MBX3609182.1 alpha/beta fold hydrolase [Hydrogenophaga sp.]
MDMSSRIHFFAGRTPSGTYFERFGQGDGPSIVLVHGLGCDLTMWTGLNRLAAIGPVWTFDLCGHGRTASNTPSSIDGYVEQLNELMAFNRIDRCLLVGFSLGGVIATAASAARFSAVSGLVLSNVPFARRRDELERASTRIDAVRENGLSEMAPSMVLRWFPSGYLDSREELKERLIDMILRNDEEQFISAYKLALTGDKLIAKVAGNVTCPAMVLGGGKDVSVREETLVSLASKFGCKEVIFEHSGHMLPIQCASAFVGTVAQFSKELGFPAG